MGREEPGAARTVAGAIAVAIGQRRVLGQQLFHPRPLHRGGSPARAGLEVIDQAEEEVRRLGTLAEDAAHVGRNRVAQDREKESRLHTHFDDSRHSEPGRVAPSFRADTARLWFVVFY